MDFHILTFVMLGEYFSYFRLQEIPENTRRLPNVVTMLAHRLR